MNATELKIKIFREVDSLESSKLLEFYGLLQNFINSEKEEDEWIGLSETEIQGIRNAINELDAGKGRSHYLVMKGIREKYNNA